MPSLSLSTIGLRVSGTVVGVVARLGIVLVERLHRGGVRRSADGDRFRGDVEGCGLAPTARASMNQVSMLMAYTPSDSTTIESSLNSAGSASAISMFVAGSGPLFVTVIVKFDDLAEFDHRLVGDLGHREIGVTGNDLEVDRVLVVFGRFVVVDRRIGIDLIARRDLGEVGEGAVAGGRRHRRS